MRNTTIALVISLFLIAVATPVQAGQNFNYGVPGVTQTASVSHKYVYVSGSDDFWGSQVALKACATGDNGFRFCQTDCEPLFFPYSAYHQVSYWVKVEVTPLAQYITLSGETCGATSGTFTIDYWN